MKDWSRVSYGRWGVLAIALGLVGWSGPDCGGEPPIDRVVATIAGKLGVGFEGNLTLGTWVPNETLRAVNFSFDEAAGIAFTLEATAIVPTPSGGVWPNSDAQLEGIHNANLWNGGERQWHLYFVTRLEGQSGCSQVLGLTNTRTNNPYTSPGSRWSYVFVDNVRDVKANCAGMSNVPFLNFVTAITAHEMGHQRGGLTENAGGPPYHLANVSNDIMGPGGPSFDKMASTRYFSFCRSTPQGSQDPIEGSCAAVLFQFREAN